MSYFETRTKSINGVGTQAIQELDAVLHKVKIPQFLEPRDFVSISNNYSLHAREVISITDKIAHKKRWLLKTFDVNNIEEHEQHFIEGLYLTSNE